MTPLILASAMFIANVPLVDVQLDRQPQTLKTGRAFRNELGRPLTASWQNVPVRTVLRRIGESRKVSVVLDRRVDPTQRIAVEFSNQSLESAFGAIAAKIGGHVRVLASTVYVGPHPSAGKLRTLAAVRFQELQPPTTELPRGRLAELGNRRTLHWNDLDSPSEILQKVAGSYRLQIDNPERVPHDLWASATLPAVNVIEAFSLVLIQFDLTIRWGDRKRTVQIVPVPKDVSISRSYLPRNLSATAATKEWTEKVEGIRATPDGRNVKVTGTVEHHERIAALLRPSGGSPSRPETPETPVPLAKRSYAKLKFSRVPAIALIQRLEKTGIVFDYDTDELNAAGIDLKTPISMDLKDAAADEVFSSFCKQLGLKYATEGLTVRLSPK